MAAELLEIKSNSLLPKPEVSEEDEEDPREKLIKRLLEYEQYKKVTEDFKEFESKRQEVYTREPDSLDEYKNGRKIIISSATFSHLQQARAISDDVFIHHIY